MPENWIIERRRASLKLLRDNLNSGMWNRVKIRPSKASEENRKELLRFDSECEALGKTHNTRINYISAFHSLAEYLGEKPFREATKEDLLQFLEFMKATRGEKSYYQLMVCIKIFYKWLNGGEDYPDCVRWIKARNKRNLITADKILTQDEIRLLITSAKSFRDKAIISVLYETGCRISEFLGMRIRNIRFDEFGALVDVDGKTGEWEIRIKNSVPYLNEWLKLHPTKNDVNSYVWTLENNGNRPLGRYGIISLLHSLKLRCNLQKNLYPHIFRHSRATELAGKLSTTILNKCLGWTTSSNMSEVYIHHSQKQVDNAMLTEVYGVSKDEIERSYDVIDKLLPKLCFNCNEKNIAEVDYCTKCSYPLNQEEFKEKLEKASHLDKLIEARVEQLLAKYMAKLMMVRTR